MAKSRHKMMHVLLCKLPPAITTVLEEHRACSAWAVRVLCIWSLRDVIDWEKVCGVNLHMSSHIFEWIREAGDSAGKHKKWVKITWFFCIRFLSYSEEKKSMKNHFNHISNLCENRRGTLTKKALFQIWINLKLTVIPTFRNTQSIFYWSLLL